MSALAVAFALAALARGVSGGPDSAKPAALPKMYATYEYDFSSPTGLVPLTWPSLWHDRFHSETFVIGEGFVRIFDESGMETFRFGDDGSLGTVLRVVELEEGGLIVLSLRDGKRVLLHCDYKGELIAQMALSGVPEPFANFEPDVMVLRNGLLYLAERGTMRVLVTDVEGNYRRSYQLRPLVASRVAKDAETRPGGFIDGFSVDDKGNMLFTMSTMFAAGVVSPGGEVRMFGTRGGQPGRFNNLGGIDADEKGNIYITDRLKSVVSVWSPELRFLGEFGYRGWDTSNLVTPYEIAIGEGRVFVAQAAARGVRVFRVRFVDAVEAAPAAGGAQLTPGKLGAGGSP